MSTKIETPVYNADSKPYERYKQELYAWREITNLAKEKQAIAIALSLPENDPKNIREKVFDEISLADLKKDTGMDTLITFLDTILLKEDLADCFERYEHFEEVKREEGQSINDFIEEYDMRRKRIEKKDIKLPQVVLAFKFLKCARITKEERLLVLTGVD